MNQQCINHIKKRQLGGTTAYAMLQGSSRGPHYVGRLQTILRRCLGPMGRARSGAGHGRSWSASKWKWKWIAPWANILRNVQTHSEVSLAVEDDELFVELVRKSWKLWLSPKGMSQEISMQNWAAKNICWLDVLSWEMIEIEEDQWRRSLLGWRGLGLPGYPPFQFSSFASNIKLANIDIIYHISWSNI